MDKYKIILILIVLIAGVYLAGLFVPDNPKQTAPANISIPDRVISINPAATEIIYKLGCEDKLIAISDFCNYPPQTDHIQKIGGAINPNLEKLNALKPELVIVQGQCKDILNFCEHKNIETLNIHLRDIDEIYQGIIQLGDKLNSALPAEKLCRTIKDQLETIKIKVSSTQKKKIFISLYRTPGSLSSITTIGPDTYLSELIAIAGGINIFNDVHQDYPVISKETLLKRQPEIIIELSSEPHPEQFLEDWSKLGRLNAVQNRQFYALNADLVLKPGPRVTQAAIELAKLIHPELIDE